MTLDLQFWSEDLAVKLHITLCFLHVCLMWYFLRMRFIWRHFPSVDLSEGSQDNKYRLVIFVSRGSTSHFFSICPEEERMAYGWKGHDSTLDLVQPLSKLVATLLFLYTLTAGLVLIPLHDLHTVPYSQPMARLCELHAHRVRCKNTAKSPLL